MSDGKKRAERIAGDAVISSIGADLRKKYKQKQRNSKIKIGAAFAVVGFGIGYPIYSSVSDYFGSLNAMIDDSPEVTAEEQTEEAEINEERKDPLSTIIRELTSPISP